LIEEYVELRIENQRLKNKITELEHKLDYSVNKPSQPVYVYKSMIHTQNRYDILQEDLFSGGDTTET